MHCKAAMSKYLSGTMLQESDDMSQCLQIIGQQESLAAAGISRYNRSLLICCVATYSFVGRQDWEVHSQGRRWGSLCATDVDRLDLSNPTRVNFLLDTKTTHQKRLDTHRDVPTYSYLLDSIHFHPRLPCIQDYRYKLSTAGRAWCCCCVG